jgi:hypothetical protein
MSLYLAEDWKDVTAVPSSGLMIASRCGRDGSRTASILSHRGFIWSVTVCSIQRSCNTNSNLLCPWENRECHLQAGSEAFSSAMHIHFFSVVQLARLSVAFASSFLLLCSPQRPVCRDYVRRRVQGGLRAECVSVLHQPPGTPHHGVPPFTRPSLYDLPPLSSPRSLSYVKR